MNETQRKITAEMLDIASDEFIRHGCNDFALDNTPENLQFIKDMIAQSDYPEDEPMICDGEILTMDWIVMRYCRDLLLKCTECG